ncbi:hypothetical protein M0R19_05915 [Candidatus Pacearchaeota archaeon]|nr:hypothetical protein [Candidatus Pacearchaeota archaeon]
MAEVKEVTVNRLLVVMTNVRQRLNELIALRGEVSKKEHYYGDTEKVSEPLYDVKKVDEKIVELRKFLFEADASLKEVNAKTKVKIVYDIDSLLESLK